MPFVWFGKPKKNYKEWGGYRPPMPSHPVTYQETPLDRIERVYADALEILRRAYDGTDYTRRGMQRAGMGGRRWTSAVIMLRLAGLLSKRGELRSESAVMARRTLWAAKEHYAQKIRETRGAYTPPF